MAGDYRFFSDTNEVEFCNDLEDLGVPWETQGQGVVRVFGDDPAVDELVAEYGGMMVSGQNGDDNG